MFSRELTVRHDIFSYCTLHTYIYLHIKELTPIAGAR